MSYFGRQFKQRYLLNKKKNYNTIRICLIVNKYLSLTPQSYNIYNINNSCKHLYWYNT